MSPFAGDHLDVVGDLIVRQIRDFFLSDHVSDELLLGVRSRQGDAVGLFIFRQADGAGFVGGGVLGLRALGRVEGRAREVGGAEIEVPAGAETGAAMRQSQLHNTLITISLYSSID